MSNVPRLKLVNFTGSSASTRLQEIESNNGVHGETADKLRKTLVAVLSRFQTSRFDLCKALAAYKKLFKKERGWMVAARYIGEELLHCGEQTVRNLAGGYERISDLPETFRSAALARNVELAERGNLRIVEKIEEALKAHRDDPFHESFTQEDVDRIVGDAILAVKFPPKEAKDKGVDASENDAELPPLLTGESVARSFAQLTDGEKHAALRIFLKEAINDAADPAAPLREATSALEEALFELGQTTPVTVTLTPHAPSQGKRDVAPANDDDFVDPFPPQHELAATAKKAQKTA